MLWVKASGLWLADALTRDIFVPVALEPVLAGIAADAADPVSGAVVAALNPEGLRPSIETTLHALLPHRIVVHTHSVRTIALAIRTDGEAQVAERLAGLRWAWVPYCKPGLPLTRTVAEALARGPADILVLGNHGLVVGAESVAQARAMLDEVERRLDGPARRAAPAEAPRAEPGHRLPKHPLVHTLAVEPQRLHWACTGSLYPDHVIFLGPAARSSALGSESSKLLLRPGAGALLAEGTGASADELALCLALVLERVPRIGPPALPDCRRRGGAHELGCRAVSAGARPLARPLAAPRNDSAPPRFRSRRRGCNVRRNPATAPNEPEPTCD